MGMLKIVSQNRAILIALLKYNKMRNVNILILFISVMLSCVDDSKRVDNNIFVNRYKMNPVKYKINEIIKPVDIIVLDDYLVIMNELVSRENIFFVYSLSSFEFLYSFANKGHGPKDYIAPELIQNPSGNSLSVFDQFTFKLLKYQIGKEQESIIEERIVEIEDKRPLQEIYYHSYSIIIFSTLDNKIQSYNLNVNKIVDSFQFKTNLKENMNSDYNLSFDGFHFAYNNQNIIVGFYYLNKLVRGEVDAIGNISMRESVIESESIPKISIFDNTLYYMYVYLSSDFIFAQYSGYLFKELQPFPINLGKRKFDMLLEVYNRNGEPVALIDLQHDFLRCKIDEKNKKIYTWNLFEDFDFLLAYDYSIIK